VTVPSVISRVVRWAFDRRDRAASIFVDSIMRDGTDMVN